MRRILIGLTFVVVSSGCVRLGTRVTLDVEKGRTARAVDQEILSEAIDSAFAQLAPPAFKRTPPPAPVYAPPPEDPMLPPPPPAAPPEQGPLTAYIEVQTSMDVPQAVLDYTAARASVVAARAGIGIKEVVTVLERQPGTGTERAYVQYPDTDLRVVVAVTYAGVDEVFETQVLRNTERRGNLLVGRFKGTVAIVPRNESISPWMETVSGEARYDLDELKYTRN